jgi:hypothetical protein
VPLPGTGGDAALLDRDRDKGSLELGACLVPLPSDDFVLSHRGGESLPLEGRIHRETMTLPCAAKNLVCIDMSCNVPPRRRGPASGACSRDAAREERCRKEVIRLDEVLA